jgi:hypothetical protein
MADMFNPAGLEEGLPLDVSPQLQPLVADQEATELEEDIMGAATIDMMDWLYSDQGLQAVVNMLKQDSRELFEKVPDVVVPLLEKVRNGNPDADSATFFGENGLIQMAIDEVLGIAEQEQIPGSMDEEQKQAVVINTYRKIGEVLEQDESSKEGAKELGDEMLRTKDDGSLMSEEKLTKAGMLGNEIRRGLLS